GSACSNRGRRRRPWARRSSARQPRRPRPQRPAPRRPQPRPPRPLLPRHPPPSTRRSPSSMAEVVILENAATAGALVADEIVRLVRRKPDAVLALATGSTPLPVYEALHGRLAGTDVSQVRGFALDEYVGLNPAHPESYRS